MKLTGRGENDFQLEMAARGSGGDGIRIDGSPNTWENVIVVKNLDSIDLTPTA